MEEEGEETMKAEEIFAIMGIIEYWLYFFIWGTLVILTILSFGNESIEIEYKMIWFLLALLGFTIAKNQTRERQ